MSAVSTATLLGLVPLTRKLPPDLCFQSVYGPVDFLTWCDREIDRLRRAERVALLRREGPLIYVLVDPVAPLDVDEEEDPAE